MRKYIMSICLLTQALISVGQNYVSQWATQSYAIDSNVFANSGKATLASAIVDEDGNRYVLTNYTGKIEVYHNDTVHYPNANDFVGNGGSVLRKLDPQGNVLWTKPMAVEAYQYLGTDFTVPDLYGQKLAWHHDGTLLMMVSMKRKGQLWYNNELSLSNIGEFADTLQMGFILANIDTSGAVVWKQRFRFNYFSNTVQHEYETISLLESDNSGNIYVAGRTSGFILIGDTAFHYVNCLNCWGSHHASLTAFAMKLNSQGENTWLNMAKYTSAATTYEKIRPHPLAHRATVDDSGNVYLSFISDLAANVNLSFDDDTISYPANGQHFFIARLNGQTGNSDWFKPFKCEFSNVGNVFNDNGTIGALEVIDDTVYNVINPHFLRVESVALDSADTLTNPAPFGAYGYLVKVGAETGNIGGYDLLRAPDNSNTHIGSTSIHSSTVFEDNLYFAAYNANTLQANGFSLNAYAANALPTMVVKYQPAGQTYSVHRVLRGDNVHGITTRVFEFTANGDYYIGGRFDLAADFDETELSSISGSLNGFHTKFRNCDYLVDEILGDATICSGDSTILHALQHDSVDYAWSHNGFIINGQTDSILETSVGGTYRVIVTDTLGCDATSPPFLVTAQQPGSITLNLNVNNLCQTDSPVILSGGEPAGGIYLGGAVSAGVFDPATALVGTNQVLYAAVDSIGCQDTVSDQIYVEPEPSVTFFQSFNTACTGDSIVLNSGLPVGGVYSGNGVVGNIFAPALQDTGSQWLYYTRTNNGCSATDSIEVTVTASPQVAFNFPVDTTCEASSPIALTGQSPAGGTFSGTGVSGNFFIPQIVSPGEYAITYSITESGCTGSASDTIQVDSFPQVVLPALDSICLSATNYVLDHGYPSGGTYSGLGISNNIFDASVAGIGTHTVSYIYENACAADTAVSTITVIASPVLSATISDVSCNGLSDGAINAQISGGNAPYTFTWNTGDSTTQINNLIAGIYTLTATGEGGCTATNNFTVTESAVLSAQIDSLTDVVCNGFDDGEAYVSATGGNAPYNYLWSNNQVSSHATNLGAGTHQVLVTDANGCQDSVSVSISELDPIVISSSATDVSCADQAEGSISTTASGGGGSYTYAWSSGQSSNTITNLDSGTYVLTVSDQNACTAEDTFVIEKPDSLQVSFSSQNISCNGSNDGYIAATAEGGTGVLDFLWNTTATSDSIGGIGAGTYTLTVSDANGCELIESQSITEPDTLSINLSITQNIPCQGDNNGAILASVSGGTSSYAYQWSTGGTMASISGLSSGIFTVNITDANGCQKADSIILSEPSQLTTGIDSTSDASCFGANDGYLAASATGGTGSINYAWSSGSTANNANNLVAGTYTVTATDANGCTTTAMQSISEPAEITLAISSDDVNCFGGNDGQATATIGNGQGSFTYTWSNAATTATADSLIAGSYAVTATDAAGCFVSDTVNILEPTELSATFTVNQNLCHDDSTGNINTTMSGGLSPYSYVWSNTNTTSNLSNVSAGSYSLTITDDNGCTLDTSFVLNNPLSLDLTVNSLTNLLCFDDNSGHIEVMATGGTGSMNYLWNDNNTNAIRSGLSAGMHSVTITDANGCELDSTFILDNPTQVALSVDSISDLLCYDDNTGYIEASATGGTGALDFLWNDNNTNPTRSGLSAATFSVTVTDANGCTADTALTLTEPQELVLQVNNIQYLDCYADTNGTIEVATTGGTGSVDFLWNTSATIAQINNLQAGVYSVTATDENGCLADSTIQLTQPDSINTAITITNAHCDNTADGSITINTSGGTSPYDFMWSNGAVVDSITNLEPANYGLSITDANGCESMRNIEVGFDFQSPQPVLGANTGFCENDSLLLDPQVNNMTYDWSTGDTTQTITVNNPGEFAVLVTDQNGCSNSDTIEIEEYDLPEFDLGNDTLFCRADLENGFTLSGPDSLANYHWSTGGTDQVETVTDFGTYFLTVESAEGCFYTDSIAVISDTCLGVDARYSPIDITVYPNPNFGRFTVESTVFNSDNFSLRILNAEGRLVAEKSLTEATEIFDLSSHGAGVYYLHFVSAEHTPVVKKVVVY